MTYIHITILAYFLTDILNWQQMLWGNEKHLFNSLHEKLKKKGFFKTNINSKEFFSSKKKQIN